MSDSPAIPQALLDYPGLTRWFGRQRLATLRSDSGRIAFGFLNLQERLGTENIAPYLERFAVSDLAFEQILDFYAQIPFVLDYMQDGAAGSEEANPLELEILADGLCRVVPGHWKYEVLLKELIVFDNLERTS